MAGHFCCVLAQAPISLTEVYNIMDSGASFQIGFVTCDRFKRKGGEFIQLRKCIKHNHATPAERKHLRSKATDNKSPIAAPERNPNHYANGTVNIKNTINGALIKVHTRLILQFNNQPVL